MFTIGQRVRHTTSGQFATVLRVSDYGDIWVMIDGAYVPLTTRACFLQAA